LNKKERRRMERGNKRKKEERKMNKQERRRKEGGNSRKNGTGIKRRKKGG
jgi:hypothetical protein